MRKSYPIVALIALLLVGCVLATPRQTAEPAAPTALPSATVPPSVSPTPANTSTAMPTPTTAATLPVQAVGDGVLAWDWEDLAPYQEAMLPDFAADVARFAGAPRYLIAVTFDLEGLAYEGRMRVRYTNQEQEPLAQVVFRLLPNTPGYGGRLIVSEVLVNGTSVTPELSLGSSALSVPLAQPLAPAAAVEIEMAWTGTLPTEPSGYAHYGYLENVLAMPNFYPMIPVYDDEGWNVEVAPSYGDATFTDTGLYAVQATLPAAVKAAFSGLAIGQETGGGTTTYTVVTGPMRDFYLVGSAEYEVVSGSIDGVTINSYYLPDDAEGGARALDYALNSLQIYNDLFGPYPFNELDVVGTPTEAGGIEYPGAIVVAEGLYDRTGGFFESATAHEVGHQWWYSLVGNDQLDEPWLDEALTQYTTLLYIEQRYGKEAARQMLEDSFERSYEILLEQDLDMPAGLPVAAYSGDLYGAVVYGKGPLFFHDLRQQVGDETFYEILRTYFEDYRYGVAYPADFMAVAESVSGQELDPLYARWIAD